MGQQGWKDGSTIKRTHWLKQEAHEFIANSDCTGKFYLKKKKEFKNNKQTNKQKNISTMSFRLEKWTRLSMVKSGSFQPLLIDDPCVCHSMEVEVQRIALVVSLQPLPSNLFGSPFFCSLCVHAVFCYWGAPIFLWEYKNMYTHHTCLFKQCYV